MDKLQIQWELVKEANPELLFHCYALCKTAQDRGIKRWSADAMFHVLRWESALSTGDLGVKVNNNYSSLAARDLMDAYPELEGFFSLRVRKPRGIETQFH